MWPVPIILHVISVHWISTKMSIMLYEAMTPGLISIRYRCNMKCSGQSLMSDQCFGEGLCYLVCLYFQQVLNTDWTRQPLFYWWNGPKNFSPVLWCNHVS